MKKFLLAVLLLAPLACFAAGPMGMPVPLIQNPTTGQTVNASYPLPVEITGGVTVTIGSTTFTASPVFSDAAGTGTLALVDSSRRIIITIGSETLGLISAINNVRAAVATISAALPVASTTIGTFTTGVYSIPLVSGASEITIVLANTGQQAWTTFGNATPSVGNGIPFTTSLHIERLNASEAIKVTASETVSASWIQR